MAAKGESAFLSGELFSSPALSAPKAEGPLSPLQWTQTRAAREGKVGKACPEIPVTYNKVSERAEGWLSRLMMLSSCGGKLTTPGADGQQRAPLTGCLK